jgi:hypothetical protein
MTDVYTKTYKFIYFHYDYDTEGNRTSDFREYFFGNKSPKDFNLVRGSRTNEFINRDDVHVFFRYYTADGWKNHLGVDSVANEPNIVRAMVKKWQYDLDEARSKNWSERVDFFTKQLNFWNKKYVALYDAHVYTIMELMR